MPTARSRPGRRRCSPCPWFAARRRMWPPRWAAATWLPAPPIALACPGPICRPASAWTARKAPAKCRRPCWGTPPVPCASAIACGCAMPRPASCASASMSCTWWRATAWSTSCPPTAARGAASSERELLTPVSWETELEELRRREELAKRMGGDERVAHQHASGRLTVRERIERLLDAGSFHETGALAGSAEYRDGELAAFTPANTVVGSGRIDGRRVAVQADDFTVRGGAADAAIWQKMVWAERYAHDMRVPLVRLVDGTGGGGSVKTLETMGFSYVPPLPGFDLVVANLSRVPVVAAALGPTAGLGAARVVTSHFSVIVSGPAQQLVAGPPRPG